MTGLLRLLLVAGALAAAATAASAQTRDELWNLCRSKDLDIRIANCTKAIEGGDSDKNLALLYIFRGNGYDDRKQSDLALRDYGEAIRLDPTNAYGYLNRGIAYNRRGEYDRALSDLDRTVALNPSLNSYSARCETYLNKRDYNRAIQECTRSLQVSPNYFYALYFRGQAYYQTKAYDLAIGDLDQAAKQQPNDPYVYDWRGKAYEAKGDRARAEEDYARAKTLRSK